MRRAIVLSICALAPSSIAAAQIVDSAGFFVQYQGTLTASDTNPLFGGDGEPMVPDQPMHVDLDPDYDWFILETMVSDPVHTDPFYLWPSLEEPFGTHEMGFSMGLLGIFCDTNGDDPSDWGTGELGRRPEPGDLRPHPQLPDDTRLWAALQHASGGTWSGCVFDVDEIVETLNAGMAARNGNSR